jgi:hypothetical protein
MMARVGRGVAVLVACLGGLSPAFGDDLSIDDRITRLCNELNQATFDGHPERALALTYPKLVAAAGKDNVLAALKASAAGNPDFQPLDIRCQPPAQHSSAAGLDFALVPMMTRARVADGTLLSPGHYLAISENAGASWTFLYLKAGVTIDKLKFLFPDGIGDMPLPAEQKPIFIPSHPDAAASAP